MEADNGNREQGTTPVSTLPHLDPKLLVLALLNLLGCGDANLVELSLEFCFINAAITQFPQRGQRFFLPPLSHEPTRALGEEEEANGLNSGDDEEHGERDAV